MSQRFTVELERIDVLRTSLEVVAKDMPAATAQAARVASTNPRVWDVDRGMTIIKKVTAHPNKWGPP